jgi:hypothetical protein
LLLEWQNLLEIWSCSAVELLIYTHFNHFEVCFFLYQCVPWIACDVSVGMFVSWDLEANDLCWGESLDVPCSQPSSSVSSL